MCYLAYSALFWRRLPVTVAGVQEVKVNDARPSIDKCHAGN